MWYLSEELVPLSLCDEGLENEEKKHIVEAMLTAGRPQAPQMKSHLLLGLHEFVG